MTCLNLLKFATSSFLTLKLHKVMYKLLLFLFQTPCIVRYLDRKLWSLNNECHKHHKTIHKWWKIIMIDWRCKIKCSYYGTVIRIRCNLSIEWYCCDELEYIWFEGHDSLQDTPLRANTEFIQAQKKDPTLNSYWTRARAGSTEFTIRDGLLYKKAQVNSTSHHEPGLLMCWKIHGVVD